MISSPLAYFFYECCIPFRLLYSRDKQSMARRSRSFHGCNKARFTPYAVYRCQLTKASRYFGRPLIRAAGSGSWRGRGSVESCPTPALGRIRYGTFDRGAWWGRVRASSNSSLLLCSFFFVETRFSLFFLLPSLFLKSHVSHLNGYISTLEVIIQFRIIYRAMLFAIVSDLRTFATTICACWRS